MKERRAETTKKKKNKNKRNIHLYSLQIIYLSKEILKNTKKNI